MMNAKVVLADFENDAEYHEIKDPHGTAFPTLAMHRVALQEAVRNMEEQGYEVAVEICDLAGYLAFCLLQNAANTPQTVAAYVVMKHGGAEKKYQQGLDHQNITVDRTAKVFCEMCKATGLKKSAIAKMCGVTPNTISRYCTGFSPVPQAVWKLVEMEAQKNTRG